MNRDLSSKPQWLSVREAANAYSMSEVTIRRLVASRVLASTKIGRSRRIPVEALQQLADAGASPERQLAAQ